MNEHSENSSKQYFVLFEYINNDCLGNRAKNYAGGHNATYTPI